MARLVYSTGPRGSSAACPRCGEKPCVCEARDGSPARRPEVRVRRERAGRGGKTVTTAAPFELSRSEAAALLRELKRGCGSGGTIKRDSSEAGFRIELQGDHVQRLLEALRARGYRAKRAGG